MDSVSNPSSAARRKPRNLDGYGVFSYLESIKGDWRRLIFIYKIH